MAVSPTQTKAAEDAVKNNGNGNTAGLDYKDTQTVLRIYDDTKRK